jgi:hypothetical protein
LSMIGRCYDKISKRIGGSMSLLGCGPQEAGPRSPLGTDWFYLLTVALAGVSMTAAVVVLWCDVTR